MLGLDANGEISRQGQPKNIPRGVPRDLPVWDIFLFYHPCQDRICGKRQLRAGRAVHSAFRSARVTVGVQLLPCAGLPDAGMQNGEAHNFVAFVAHNYIVIR